MTGLFVLALVSSVACGLFYVYGVPTEGGDQ